MASKFLTRFNNSGLRYWWLVSIILISDLVTKWLADHYLVFGQALHIGWCLNFTLVYNTGAAFSLLNNGLWWPNILFSSLAMIIIIIILWRLYYNNHSSAENFALAMIVGGALGNLLGRIYSGHVVDFIDLALAQWHWPVFNIADMSICCGAFWLLKCI